MSNNTLSTSRDSAFRYVPADTIGLSFSDNSVKIIFGIEEMPGKISEQIGIMLPPVTAKVLVKILALAIDHLESQAGREIPFDQGKVDSLRALITAQTGGAEAE